MTWRPPVTQTDGSSFDDLAGYRIYYGVQEDQLRCQVEIRDPKATSWKIDGLSPGTWYFAIVSFNNGFVESEYSTISSKQID